MADSDSGNSSPVLFQDPDHISETESGVGSWSSPLDEVFIGNLQANLQADSPEGQDRNNEDAVPQDQIPINDPGSPAVPAVDRDKGEQMAVSSMGAVHQQMMRTTTIWMREKEKQEKRKRKHETVEVSSESEDDSRKQPPSSKKRLFCTTISRGPRETSDEDTCSTFSREPPETSDEIEEETTRRKKMNCHICGTSVVHLLRHLRQVHGMDVRGPKKGTVAKSKSGYNYRYCPIQHCGKAVCRLRQHLKQTHGMTDDNIRGLVVEADRVSPTVPVQERNIRRPVTPSTSTLREDQVSPVLSPPIQYRPRVTPSTSTPSIAKRISPSVKPVRGRVSRRGVRLASRTIWPPRGVSSCMEIQIHPSDTTRWVLTTKVFLQECTWHHRYCYIKHNSGEISYFLFFIYRTKCDKQPTKYVLCYSSKYQHWVITNIFHYTSYKSVHDIFYNFGTKPLLWVFLLDVASEIAHIDSGELPRLYLTCAMVST